MQVLNALKDKIRQKVISEYSGLFSKETIEKEELREAVAKILEDIVYRERNSLSEADKKKIISEMIDELTGFGPIESLLKDPLVTEIMINGPKKVYVERLGKSQLTPITFNDEQQLMALIYKIIAPTRRHVDESYPYTEVSLRDGSRVNIVIPPLALNGPTITIRKFLKEINTVENLIKLETLDKRMADFLVACIKAKINSIFSGATGAGKTTTLNVLSSYIGNDERIVTIEDTAELNLKQNHVVRLESRQPSIEGRGAVSIRELFKNSLRMRPDRIILGEIRGSEALDMLQAICSGHTGSLSVIHANSPRDVIYRIETMILTSGVPISLEAIYRQIATAINLIVQQEQLSDGSRKITHITEVNGLNDGQVCLDDIFVYEIDGVDTQGKVKGSWKATGKVPSFYPLFKKSGILLSEEVFRN
ncbi:MAG: type II secretion system protein E [Omnitrophica WOR_2 bacterium RIFCSPLOWO2_01_FULL_41_12]|nr:MAG: type II secretion system protein E [Omnitrophica WOR_2 bacterium RIFCSPLOWO2_01_FULL_41_12]